MSDECGPEMMREHERRITEACASATSAHERINGVVVLIRDFTIEMRESNKNISESNKNISDLVVEVRGLTKEVSYVSKATNKHEDDITEIKDNMETKDTVLKLYDRIEAATEEYRKGQDGVMALLRKNEKDLKDHKDEPALQALESQNAIRRWLLTGFGGIIFAIITMAATILIFNK